MKKNSNQYRIVETLIKIKSQLLELQETRQKYLKNLTTLRGEIFSLNIVIHVHFWSIKMFLNFSSARLFTWMTFF